jgi:predicted CoA-binding protein
LKGEEKENKMVQEIENEFVPPDEEIKEILKTNKVIAVVGLSNDRKRYSYRVGNFLKARGYKVIPVNPKYETVIGLKSYPSLSDVPEEVDIVDIFRKSEAVGPIVDEAIRKKVNVVWMQEGVKNVDAAFKAQEAGIKVVMDRCMFKEYDRLFMHR